MSLHVSSSRVFFCRYFQNWAYPPNPSPRLQIPGHSDTRSFFLEFSTLFFYPGPTKHLNTHGSFQLCQDALLKGVILRKDLLPLKDFCDFLLWFQYLGLHITRHYVYFTKYKWTINKSFDFRSNKLSFFYHFWYFSMDIMITLCCQHNLIDSFYFFLRVLIWLINEKKYGSKFVIWVGNLFTLCTEDKCLVS